MNSISVAFSVILALLISVAAGDDESGWIIPDPDEITEAYQTGLIEYDDYQALVEIALHGCANADDSLLLRQYADILTGLSANPVLREEEEPSGTSTPVEKASSRARAPIFQYRHDQKLTATSESRQLYRLRRDTKRMALYGEYSHEYTGAGRWNRRAWEYRWGQNGSNKTAVTLGNFNDRFGLGLLYGYHGRLLTASDDHNEWEDFLFPHFGGSNGLRLAVGRGDHRGTLVYDTDRNGKFQKHFVGASLAAKSGVHTMALSGGWGVIRERENGRIAQAAYLSGAGESKVKGFSAGYELAGALRGGRLSGAVAGNIRTMQKRNTVTVSGWHYDTRYPAWFAGGVSSRRSRSMTIDEIDMAWRDRFSGETGGVVKVNHPLGATVSLHTAIGYAWRGDDDNRAEGIWGVTWRGSRLWQVKVDCYWRGDNVYSDQSQQRRLQAEVVRRQGVLRTRLAAGFQSDRRRHRDDFMIYCEHRVTGRTRSFSFIAKLDRLRPGDLRLNSAYMTMAHEADIGAGLRSQVKYTYRYNRDSAAGRYGQFRWDLLWMMP